MVSFFNTYPGFSSDMEGTIVAALENIVSEYGLRPVYINVIFLADDELLKLNVEYLGHNYYTDILTFNYSELPKTIEAELYISIDRVKENAATNHVSLNDEMGRVIIHGMLHLAGFNDGSDLEKSEMRKLEDKFLFHVKQDKETISA